MTTSRRSGSSPSLWVSMSVRSLQVHVDDLALERAASARARPGGRSAARRPRRGRPRGAAPPRAARGSRRRRRRPACALAVTAQRDPHREVLERVDGGAVLADQQARDPRPRPSRAAPRRTPVTLDAAPSQVRARRTHRGSDVDVAPGVLVGPDRRRATSSSGARSARGATARRARQRFFLLARRTSAAGAARRGPAPAGALLLLRGGRRSAAAAAGDAPAFSPAACRARARVRCRQRPSRSTGLGVELAHHELLADRPDVGGDPVEDQARPRS